MLELYAFSAMPFYFFLYFIHMQKFSTNLCVVFGENCIAGMSVAWGSGVHAPLFYQILAGQLTLSQLRDQIMPTNYYMPPPPADFQTFRHPYIGCNKCMYVVVVHQKVLEKF